VAIAQNKNLPAVRFKRGGGFEIQTRDKELADFIRLSALHSDGAQLFIRGIMPSSFGGAWTEQRKDYLRRISNYSIPRSYTIARRGFGKTSLLIGEIIRVLCFRLKGFILFTSSEQGISEERTESIRSFLMTSPEIRDIFGHMRPQSVDGLKEVFGAKSWRLADPIDGYTFAAIVPKSENQSVNGLNIMINGKLERPDLILNDDGEDRKTLNNEEIRAAHRRWMTDVLFPCVDTDAQPDPVAHRWKQKSPVQRTPWNIRVIDTNKHPDAFLPRLDASIDTTWDGKSYPIAEHLGDDIFQSLSPETVSDAQVTALLHDFRSTGNEDGFWREYMCRSNPAGSTRFPEEFQYYRETEHRLNDRQDIDRFIIVDPALTENPKSAYSSILAVAVDRATGRVYLRRQATERMNPEDFDNELFGMSVMMNTQNIMIEGLGSNSRLQESLEQAARLRGVWCVFHSLSVHTGNVVEDVGAGREAPKRKRAIFAARLYAPFEPSHPKGHVWHEESLRGTMLEGQMRQYPDCKFWDALDCLGHIPQAMHLLGIFFDQAPQTIEIPEHLPARRRARMAAAIRAGVWRVA
jgi:hypothetical protein